MHCAIDDCTKPAKSRGWCLTHYHRWRRQGDPTIVEKAGGKPRKERPCAVEGCERLSVKREMCELHYRRWQRHGDPGPADLKVIDPSRGCKAGGCTAEHYAGDLCRLHYRRQVKHGDPFTSARPDGQQVWTWLGAPTPQPPSVEERFFARVRQGPSDCWLWDRLTASGYGLRFGPSRERQYAPHRWAYEFLRAEIPDGLVLDHLCENRACVNPWHLEPVTQRVNVLRAYRRDDVDRAPSWSA